jgi:phosphopantothenoylcysteine decarboxylase/phosphopantothenate--cysteine ligase
MDSARRVLIGITGGIAAYKIPLLVRLLRKSGCEVKAVLTPAARPLVGVEALRTLSGGPVYLDGEALYDMGHIRLSEWADVFLIAPATANTIAKIANGIADNLLTTLALSIPEGKIVVAPAMNCVMWRNGATRANVAALEARGVSVLPVGEGELACGVFGPGRMLGVDGIARHILAVFGDKPLINNKLDRYQSSGRDKLPSSDKSLSDNELPYGNDESLSGDDSSRRDKSLSGDNSLPDKGLSSNNEPEFSLAGKRVLISSGPTEEPIDPVRAITNRSSGKMGAALAYAALSMGARVTVVSGPARAALPAGAEVVAVKTASEMQAELEKRFGAADVCVMAAAVSDFRPANFSADKLQRSEGKRITLELMPNPDILAGLGAVKSGQFLVGFSLESDGGAERAKAKMKRKNCDMMVYNSVGAALGGDSTEFTLLFADGGRKAFSAMGKAEAARAIFENVARVVNTV